MQITFGEFLQKRRAELRIGLREFCETIGIDPSNYSKYERGVLPPPGDKLLRRIAKGLQINPGKNAAWTTMVELATAGRGQLPADCVRPDIVPLLPALFQKIRDQRVPEGVDPIDALVKLLHDQYSAGKKL